MSYTETQTVFALCTLANPPSGLKKKGVNSQILAHIEQGLTFYAPDIGAWNVLWGPATFTFPIHMTPAPNNTMYAAQSADGSQIVIGIAGTQGFGFDFLVEDLAVGTAKPWPYGTPPDGALIALGALVGLSILTNMTTRAPVPGAGLTLSDALRSVLAEPGDPIEVITSGHSLGGALSPALALQLRDTQHEWDPNGRATVSTCTFAGPTLGNQVLTDYATSQLAKYQRVYNTLDIVPDLWDSRSMEQIKTIYTPYGIPENAAIDLLVAGLIQRTNGIDYQQQQPGEPLEGAFNKKILKPFEPPYGADAFLTEALYQHVAAYFTLLGVRSMPDHEKSLQSAAESGLYARWNDILKKARAEQSGSK